MKKFLVVFTLIITLSMLAVNNFCVDKFCFALEKPKEYKGMIVIEQSSKRVLNEYEKDKKLPIASTTKIMTALVVLEKCKNLDEEILIDKRAVGKEGTSMYLREGEKLSVFELLAGMLLPSGNDAACALAYHLCPTMEEFADMMNKKATELGLKNTNFKNSHGLDEDGHYSSAFDLGITTSYAMQYPVFKELVSTSTLKVKGAGGDQGEIRFLNNKNRFIKIYDSATGVKTGFTDSAGRCLVASAKRGNLDLICVVLNCPDMFKQGEILLNQAFEKYNMIELLPAYNCYRKIEVEDGKQEEVKIYTKKSFSYPLTLDESLEITYEYEIPEYLTAPIKKEEVVGQVIIKLKDDELFKENIYAMDEIKSIDFLSNFKELLENWY